MTGDVQSVPHARKPPTRHLSSVELGSIYQRVRAQHPRCHMTEEQLALTAAVARATVAEFARLNGMELPPGG
jgi:hypothetical protein